MRLPGEDAPEEGKVGPETRYQESAFRFDRVEWAGSLGALFPIVVGMILINRLRPTTVFVAFGLFYHLL